MSYVERRDATRPGVLQANVAETVFRSVDCDEVGVTHLGNVSNPIWVRADGEVAAIASDDNFVVLPGQSRWIPRAPSLGAPTVVSLVSAGAAQYEVELP